VTFGDVIAHGGEAPAVFAGRETGSQTAPGGTTPAAIRSSRHLRYPTGHWRRYHHHGSIDDADALHAYQQAVRA
jgi:hypothetical protein